jgi:hypothetical protein
VKDNPQAVVPSAPHEPHPEVLSVDVLSQIGANEAVLGAGAENPKNYKQVLQSDEEAQASVPKVHPTPTATEGILLDLPAVQTSTIFTLRIYLFLAGSFVIGGMLVVMLVTVLYLDRRGHAWMDDTSTSLVVEQQHNLQAVTNAKAFFSQVLID